MIWFDMHRFCYIQTYHIQSKAFDFHITNIIHHAKFMRLHCKCDVVGYKCQSVELHGTYGTYICASIEVCGYLSYVNVLIGHHN